MLADSDRIAGYHMIRFEDLVANPLATLKLIYTQAGLDVDRLREIRMQVRRVMDAQGNHLLNGASEWDVVWLSPRELNDYFNSDVDSNQIKRLSDRDRDEFLSEAGDVMDRLGYLSEVCEDPADYCIPIRSGLRVADGVSTRRAA
jgi:hypothetical protein